MVDQESRSYRARRAFIEPEAEPAPRAAPDPAPAPATVRRPAAPSFDDEDTPKPLYRDEYVPQTLYRPEAAATRGEAPPAPAVNGGSTRPPAAPPRPDANDVGSDDTAIRSFTFAPRTRRNGDETTTILARSGSTARGHSGPGGPSGPDEIDDFDEDDGRRIGERGRWALAIGVIAAVVVLGLAIGYAVLGLGDNTETAPPPTETAGTVGPAPTSATEPPTNGGAILTNDLMLSAAQGKPLDDKRSWKETRTQRGISEDAPVPACFGVELPDNQPVSQQKILRVLGSSGKDAPSALHDATAYATVDEAQVAYSAASQTLGTCSAAGSWLASGRVVRGVGDNAVGATVAVVNGGATVWHSVVISRTGRVLNVVDASRPGEAVAPATVAEVMAEVVAKQCKPAGGTCGGKPQVRVGPPPLGGDQPGFLAAGDLPPVAGAVAPWNAAPIEPPQKDFPGSSCENVDWTTVAAEQASMRVYLHPDDRSSYFGVNQIVLTLKDEKAAKGLVDRVKTNVEDCKRLTAKVSDPKKVAGIGVKGAEVTGYTITVEQKSTQGTDKFRVGIVQAGTRVAYSFANPKGKFDFTDSQWNTISVRAGERTTQVN